MDVPTMFGVRFEDERLPPTPEQADMYKDWAERMESGIGSASNIIHTKIRPTLHVERFRQSYLQFFIEHFTKGNVNQDYWVEKVSLSVFSEVDLIDDSGNVAVVVPPLVLNETMLKEMPISPENLAFQVTQRSKSAPGIGDAMIHEAIISNLNTDLEEPLKAADAAWYKLFAYFGVLDITKKPQATTNTDVASKTPDDNEDMGFVYEDF